MSDEYEKLSTVIAEALGKRCPDFDPECLTCRAWAAMDAAEKAFSDDMNKLRADLANAGAVMVEAALRLPAYDSDGDPAGQFDHHVFVRRDDLRALSTLSPIAAAARVLLADDVAISLMAEAIHDGPLGAADHWFSAATKQGGWCVDVVRAGLRALAEQEKADG